MLLGVIWSELNFVFIFMNNVPVRIVSPELEAQ